MAVLSGPQVAQVLKAAGFGGEDLVIAVAVAKAESGWRTDAVNRNTNGSIDRGLMQINSIHHWPGDLFDPANNARAAFSIFRSSGWRAWSTFKAGRHLKFMAEARQAVAGVGNVAGNATDAGGAQGIVYGPLGPQIVVAGPGSAYAADSPVNGPLNNITLYGGQLTTEIARRVTGEVKFAASFTEVPHIQLTIADWGGQLLGKFWPLFQRGTRLTYMDLELAVNEMKFTGGDSGMGQIELTAIDMIAYKLMNLKGPRAADGMDATTFLASECQAAGMDPKRMFLGERVPSQSQLARDVPAQADTTSTQPRHPGETPPPGGAAPIIPDTHSKPENDDPSSWTTGVRLAKELGKRWFISGKRLMFGASGFTMTWAGDLKQLQVIYFYGTDQVHDIFYRFLEQPEVTRVSVGKQKSVIQVKGKVPLNRASAMRVGVPVKLIGIPGETADAFTKSNYQISAVEHSIGIDTDGVDITLIQPIDAPPEPPQSSGGDQGSAGATGGGADGQIATFVAKALAQAGDRYVFGAEVRLDDPNPSVWDCSELVQWACAQAGIPGMPDGSAAQKAHCRPISVMSGIHTKGALLFHPGHVAISLGNGKTIEAYQTGKPVGSLNATPARFNAAGLIPNANGYQVKP